MNDYSDTDDPNGDGVWSPDIEKCFREALLLFPPCGRRKHILQEDGGGKMYGRNELIARHIEMRTGKIRSRKQVSSHIQVLARRKARQESGGSVGDNGAADSASPSSSIGVSQGSSHSDSMNGLQTISAAYYDQWYDRPIVTNRTRLVEFSAFIEYRRQLPALGMAAGPSTPASAMGGLANFAAAAGPQHPSLTGGAVHQRPGLLWMPAYGNHTIPQDIHFNHQTPQTTAIVSTTASANPYQMSSATAIGNPSNNNSSSHQLQQPLNNNQHHHQLINQMNTDASNYTLTNGVNYQQQQQQISTSSEITRHSYVKIDYRDPIFRRTEKIERIDISQIQDKFPKIGGPDGLFQRGPADAFYLVKFWADINNDFKCNIDDQNSYFGFSCHFETLDIFKEITCSTKACSYGSQVVEKVEKIHGAFNSSNGRYSYEIGKTPMCEFMIQFIKKLRQLPRASQMNSVLENFTILQVITNEATSEILLCLAFVFEIASAEQQNGSQYHVYKLTGDERQESSPERYYSLSRARATLCAPTIS